MLYGGPLGTYLSGYHASGTTTSSNTPVNSNSGINTTGNTNLNRSRSARFRTPSTYNSPSPNSISLINSRSSFYTPQSRRRYPEETSVEPPVKPSYSTIGFSSNYHSRPLINQVNSNLTFVSPSSNSITRTTATSSEQSGKPNSSTIGSSFNYHPRPPINQVNSNLTFTSPSRSSTTRTTAEIGLINDKIDYKQMYIAEKECTSEFRKIINSTREEIDQIKIKLANAKRNHPCGNLDVRPLQRRSSDYENESKILDKLRSESEKLKAEHRALTRVVSRLV